MPQNEEILTFIKLVGIIHVRDLVNQDIRRDALSRLVKENKVKLIGHGLYCVSDYQFTVHSSFIQVALTMPQATISLLSALWFHGLIKQNPDEVWITVPSRSRAYKLDNLRLQTTRTPPNCCELGRERHIIDDTPVLIYSMERTIVDCFKYRNRVGLDVAIEALRNGMYQKSIRIGLIKQIAKQLRLTSVVMPYVQALQALRHTNKRIRLETAT